MSSGALMLVIGAGLPASRPRSVTIQQKLRFILTSDAGPLLMLSMSTSMVACPLMYGNLHRNSTTQSAVQFRDPPWIVGCVPYCEM